MKRLHLLFALMIGLLVIAPPSFAVFVFRAGDTVYVGGKTYTWEEWKKIRDNPSLLQQQEAPAPAQSATIRGAAPVAPVPAGEPRAAACTTAIYYDEFPSEDERFQCTAGLGMLTREQILVKGWKIDFVEKVPPLPGQPTQSPRGLPLYLYKLVISR
ncbi:MAG TPA: hypothetical protein VHE58_02800 [Burkholderiales bacterium]|nr:hypothetical protein [Burkholderiales bacterium]